MKKEEVKVGTIAQLKSGSCFMTVESIYKDGPDSIQSMQCVWFINHTLFRETFHPDALNYYNELPTGTYIN